MSRKNIMVHRACENTMIVMFFISGCPFPVTLPVPDTAPTL